MSMTSRRVKKVKIIVTNSNARLEVMAEVLEIESGGHSFGYANDSGWGVQVGDIVISCLDKKHAFKMFNKTVSALIAANTGTGHDSRV